MLAISVRQPWASLLAMRKKPVENRSWATRFRGRVLIHASKGLTRIEYDDAIDFCTRRCGLDETYQHMLRFDNLQRGGIVGEMVISDCVTEHASPYFVGPFGFVAAQARELEFTPVKGALSFFKPELPAGWVPRSPWTNKPLAALEAA
ncbi:MAG: ASCH domain-containing protein [Rubrivivax sp.]|nr:MAG: ASCH domain-containing protein [Rubrivivax sp.]